MIISLSSWWIIDNWGIFIGCKEGIVERNYIELFGSGQHINLNKYMYLIVINKAFHKAESLQGCDYPFSPIQMWVLDSVSTAYQPTKEISHVCSLRHSSGICWQDRISNLEVLDPIESTSTEFLIIRSKMWHMGQIIIMDNHCIPCQLLYGELDIGKGTWDHPYKCYIAVVKDSTLMWHLAKGNRICSCWQKLLGSPMLWSLPQLLRQVLPKTDGKLWAVSEDHIHNYWNKGLPMYSPC